MDSTPVSLRRLRRFAELLGGTLVQPFPTLCSVYRIEVPGGALQVDLTSDIHGVTSFKSLRSRSRAIEIAGRSTRVAPLADIIKSSGPLDGHATWRCCLSSKKPSPKSKARASNRCQAVLEALRSGSEQDLKEMVRRNLALPLEKRMNFLRVKLPNGGSVL